MPVIGLRPLIPRIPSLLYWQRLDLRSLLDGYGTAGGGGRFLGTPEQAYLPGMT